MPSGRRPCAPCVDVSVACGSSGLEHRVRPRTARLAMSTVATERAITCPCWRLASGSRPDTSSGRQAAAVRAWRRQQPGHAGRTPSGHRPDTVHPDTSIRTAVVPEAADGQSADRLARYSVLCSPQAGPAGGGLRRPSSRRPRHDGHRYRPHPHLGRAQRRIRCMPGRRSCQPTGARRCRAIYPKSQGKASTHISPAYRGSTTGSDVEIHTALRTRFTPLGLFRGYHGSHRFRPLLG